MIAGAVILSNTQAGWAAGTSALRPGDVAASRRGSVGGVGEMEQVAALGVVELQSPGDGVEHGGGDTADGAPFELE